MFQQDIKYFQDNNAIHTAKEINQQPKTWLKTFQLIQSQKEEIQAFINQVISNEDYDIILTGAGTSEFVGNSLFPYLNSKCNYKIKSYGTTDITSSPLHYLSKTKPTLFISFGRSGNSPESIGAVDTAEAVCGNIYHLFITCNKEGALSKKAVTMKNAYAINLADETHDQSFAMTSSFTNMMLACLLCFELNNLDCIKPDLDQVIESTNRFLNEGFTAFKKLVETYSFNRIVYLGSNVSKGIAQESALKMLELSAGEVVTMYDTPLGFRHGPKSIINDSTLTVVYLSDDPYTQAYEKDLIKEISLQRKENQLVVVSNKEYPELKSLANVYYAFNNETTLSTMMTAFNYIVVAQTLALFKSLALGITPDNPCPSGTVNRVVTGVTLYPFQ